MTEIDLTIGHSVFEGPITHVRGNTNLTLGSLDLVLMRQDEVSIRDFIGFLIDTI